MIIQNRNRYDFFLDLDMVKKIRFYCKILIIISSLLFISNSSLRAQQSKIEKVQVDYDHHSTPELFYQVPLGLTFTFKNKKTKKTRGYLHGKIRWKKIHITTNQGRVKKGKLSFDPRKVWQNHHKVTFRVTYQDTTFNCEMDLPYLQKIRFNLYTDSIKKRVPYYLNIEGVFSSHKVYPLDTSMLTFQVSNGELEKNILTITDKYQKIKQVKASAYFKLDSSINADVVIPIKTHIADPDLPSEGELLDRWKRKSRKR